jgi:site-specific recombinase XerC
MRKENHIHPPAGGAAAAAVAAAVEPTTPRLRAVPARAGVTSLPRPGDSIAGLRPGETGAADAYLSQLRESGRRSMRSRLDRAASLLLAGSDASSFPWSTLRYDDVVHVRARLSMQEASASTINMTLVALRQVARAARQLKQMTADEEAGVRDVKNVRAERLPRGRMLSEAERDLLVSACACDRTARGRRDSALVALALGAGLRREELATFPLDGFDAGGREVRLVGKGGREARLPLKESHVRAIVEWLRVRGRRPGPLLSPFDLEGRVVAGESISHQAVYRAVLRRARAAGIERCTPHDLRRTYISELLDVTDGETARGLARHKSFDTTGKYSRRGERAGREAVERLHDPYAGPTPRRTRRRAHHRRRGRRPRPANLMRKSKPELIDLAKAHGAEFTPAMTKQELADAIRSAVEG